MSVSWWMADVGMLPRRPALSGSVDVDVAILGAGFTGLWTAFHLQKLAPDLRIGIVEAEHVGYGASGRNGGWCTAGLSISSDEIARRHGRDAAVATAQAMRDTVAAIGRTCAEEGIDAQFRQGGVLTIARGRHEVAGMKSDWHALRELGLDDGCALLDADELAGRVRVGDARGALLNTHGATVHPGRLVTGLAGVVQARGATIWEGTRVTEVRPRRSPSGRAQLVTSGGTVSAKTVVLAGEAFLADLPLTRRRVLPVYSLIVMTEPLSQTQWDDIGWDNSECLSSHRFTVDYLSRTVDGRILFGGRGAPYHYASGIDAAFDRHGPTHQHLREQLIDWFPSLDGIGFAGAWGGAVALSRDWMPTVGYNPTSGVAGAYGYGGQGVATAHLTGRILAHRITGVPSDLEDLPMVGHRLRRWEPEPVRWLAVRYLQQELARLDRRGARTGRPPTGRSLAERLMRH